MHRFRILSLDGGGIKGTFTAAVLAELERMTGKRLAEYFDLITGTSTGGLIAIALGLGIPAEEVLDFYQREGPNIFPSMGIQRRVNILRWFCGPKYSATNLRNAIGCVVGNRRLGESKCRLAIPSFNAVNGDIYIFKTAHHERFKQDFKLPAIEVRARHVSGTHLLPGSPGRERSQLYRRRHLGQLSGHHRHCRGR